MSNHPGSEEEEASAHDAWPEEEDSWEAADRKWDAWWDDWDEAPSFHHSDETDLPDETVTEQRASVSPARAYLQGMSEAGPYLGLGFQIAGTMVFFVAGGFLLDRWLGSSPWGIIAGAILAFVAILFLVVRLSKEANTTEKGSSE